jgi:hypothetical protein
MILVEDKSNQHYIQDQDQDQDQDQGSGLALAWVQAATPSAMNAPLTIATQSEDPSTITVVARTGSG